MKEIPFIFVGSVTVGAGGTGTITYSIANGRNFTWCKGLYSCTVAAVMAGTDITFGGAVIAIENVAGGNIKLASGQVPIHHWFGLPGIGYGPLLLPVRYEVPNNSTIAIDIVDKTGVGGTFTLSLIGYVSSIVPGAAA